MFHRGMDTHTRTRTLYHTGLLATHGTSIKEGQGKTYKQRPSRVNMILELSLSVEGWLELSKHTEVSAPNFRRGTCPSATPFAGNWEWWQ